MQKLVREYLNEWNRKKKKRRKAGIAAALLVVLVVGTVFGTLTQYGVAMTGDTECGLEEHTHSDSCYTEHLTCSQEEGGGHFHTEDCYKAERALVCGQEESEEHTHTEECYEEQEVLVCGEEESEGHTHTDSCYETTLSCGMEEHVHTDSCYAADDAIDIMADVENPDDWDKMYEDFELTDAWGEDLAAAAKVQIGYQESDKNYTVAEDGSHKGYTRFGEFAGDAYTDWDAAFVNFCLHYAGLTSLEPKVFPDDPGETDSAKWLEEFGKVAGREENLDYLAGPDEHTPQTGDIVFFEEDDENGEKESRMGVVSSYINETNELNVIEGNSGEEVDKVEENTYDADDSGIVSYLKITELENDYKAALEAEETMGGSDEESNAADETNSAEITDSAQTTEEPEQEPEESDSLMTLEELDNLPKDEVGATIWQQQRRAGMFRMAAGRGWSFDAYYMNEDSSYDVTKTKDFSLKYQMEFRSGTNSLPKGAVEIRIPAALYKLRDSKEDVIPTDIAVPQINVEDKDKEETWIASKTSPFNCYIEENAEGEKELVFFNYKAIDAGTNAAWQVLYKNQKIMEIPDESTWELTPTITVEVPNKDVDENGDPVEAEATVESGETDPLTGRIDSKVDITQVTKQAYNMPGKKYTPGLYTKSQVERFISEGIDGKYLKEDGTLNTDEYRYAVWSVQVKGTASQPFDLMIDEIPGLRRVSGSNSGGGLLNGGGMMMMALGKGLGGGMLGGGLGGNSQNEQTTKGEVVGFKDNSNRSLGYGVVIKPEKIENIEEGHYQYRIVENCKEKDWGCRFYVVTAHPINNLEIEEGESNDYLNNQIDVKMEGVDKDSDNQPYETDEGSNKAVWTYVDYNWSYNGDLLEVTKKNTPYETREESGQHKQYTGWLKAYETAKNKKDADGNSAPEDYGNLPYYTTGNFYGYPLTHNQSSAEGGDAGNNGSIGSYKEDTYYELTTVDDFMYAYPVSGNGAVSADNMLGSEDYYYSGITVTQTDMGYDIWEDQEAEPKYEGKDIDRDVKIYVMQEDSTNWELVKTISWDTSKNTQTYVFSDEELAQWKPWRVKVVHAATDYRTTCKIDVNVTLRHDSEKLAALIESGTDSPNPIVLENISGVYGKFHQSNGTVVAYPEDKQNEGNYGEPGLKEATSDLYKNDFLNTTGKTDNLLQRDNAFKDLSGVVEKAKSVKKLGSSTNDVANSRSLVEYYLTAFDGYEISREEDYEYLKNEINSPGRTHVAFYDLLPYGMHFDPSYTVTVGRIKSLETNKTNPGYQTSWRTWDRNQIEVETTFEDDYQGTGRTMVIFHIKYSGADSSRYSETDGMWWQGWGVNFRAYYEWKNLDIIKKAANISAFMTDTADPHYGNENYRLRGKEGEVFNDDGTLAGLSPELTEDYAYFYKGNAKTEGGIDKNLSNDNFASVLFAQNNEYSDVAVSTQANLQKRVHADDDMFNGYDLSAVVEPGKGYTYEITMGMEQKMEEVVVYDILEDKKNLSAVDEPIYGTDDKSPWQGVFQSIATSGLEEVDITPEIYYRTTFKGLELDEMPNWESDEYQTKLQESLGGVDTLTEEKGWFKYDETFKPNPENPVKAIAVVLRKSKTDDTISGGNGSGAANNGLIYASFQIKMKAPEPEENFNAETQSVYAYNNPLCYTKTSGETANVETTLPGNAVKVRLKAYETFELIKEYEGDVPDAIKKKNPSFEFRLSTTGVGEDGAVTEKYLANRRYDLQVREGNEWVSQPGIHATDGNGYLELCAGEKAVFMVADASEVKVRETENLFWEQTLEPGVITEGDTSAEIGRWIKVKNKYRPVLYVQKKLQNVPDSKIDEVKDETFTIQIWEDGKNPENESGVYEYYLVDSIRMDGGIPEIVSGPYTTDKRGRFTIKQGQIVALFPGPEGTKYHLKEVIVQEPIIENIGETNGKWDWICATPEIVDTIPANGDSKTIHNNYRWKDLYLTKTLTHQNPEECTQEFTFKIEKLVPNPLGEGEAREAVNGNRWVLMEIDANGSLVEVKGSDGKTIEGVLGADISSGEIDPTKAGTLKYACAGKVIKIEGLEAGETYVVTETESGENYTPVNPSEEVKMPVYSSSAEVKITNDYQMRSLSVSKEVVKGGTEEGGESSEMSESFTMEVKVGGELLADKAYILRKKDGTIVTSENGAELKTDEFGQFTIKDGETATFENVGKKGTAFEVTEITNDKQVYPANKQPHTGTLLDENLTDNVKTADLGNISRYGSGVTFRNGSGNILLISKEYRCTDEDKEWLEKLYWLEQNRVQDINEGQLPPSQFAVTIKLTATIDGQKIDLSDRKYIEEGGIQLFESDGTIKHLSYSDSIILEPWQQIVIPVNDALKDAEFTVEEIESPEGVLEFKEQTETEKIKQYLCLVSKDEPIKTGTFGVDQTVTVYNRAEKVELQGDPVVKLFSGMLENNELPGGNLVWRLQKFENGKWNPVVDARYMIYDTLLKETNFRDTDMADEMVEFNKDNILGQVNQTLPDNSLSDQEGNDGSLSSGNKIDRSPERVARSKEILTPDGDGRIILTRREPSYDEEKDMYYLPTVYFLDEELKDVKVSLNANEKGEEGEYRLIEDMEESDDAWGMAIQCGKDEKAKHKYFLNTNIKVPVEIGKVMEDGSRPTETFTMILKQVTDYKFEWVEVDSPLVQDGKPIKIKEQRVTEITEAHPVKGIPYVLYTVDPVTGEVTESGEETGPNGEIYLRAGQYVKLELPADTKWTVEEEITNPLFELASLSPETHRGWSVKLTKWPAKEPGTNDLMLIETLGLQSADSSGRGEDVDSPGNLG